MYIVFQQRNTHQQKISKSAMIPRKKSNSTYGIHILFYMKLMFKLEKSTINIFFLSMSVIFLHFENKIWTEKREIIISLQINFIYLKSKPCNNFMLFYDSVKIIRNSEKCWWVSWSSILILNDLLEIIKICKYTSWNMFQKTTSEIKEVKELPINYLFYKIIQLRNWWLSSRSNKI